MMGGTNAFNQPLASWNVANVRYMRAMFLSCPVFNQPLGSWVTTNVQKTDIDCLVDTTADLVVEEYGMFRDAYAFDQPLDNDVML